MFLSLENALLILKLVNTGSLDQKFRSSDLIKRFGSLDVFAASIGFDKGEVVVIIGPMAGQDHPSLASIF